MSQNSAIEWTDATWNPTTGCDQVSPGCDNCYALTLAKRLKAMGNPRYQVDGRPRTSGPGFGLTLHYDKLDEPLSWKKPRRVFVNSMSDLFHDDVPDRFILRVFATMEQTPQHTYQILTKRPRRMARLLSVWTEDFNTFPLPNVWLGTSVEDQKWANQRIPLLIDTPAAVRFLSCEPLLGPVNLLPHLPVGFRVNDHREPSTQRINWVIVGGESGPGARVMDPSWARSLRDQCLEAGVPYFFKQWGGRTPKSGGRKLDGRTWDEMPTRPTAAAVPA